MPKITFVLSDDTRVETDAQSGDTLMQAAVAAGIDDIAAECGGACACGTCHCYIAPNRSIHIPAPAQDELDMIEFVIDPQDDSRLSCQIKLDNNMDGLVVRVPASQT